MKLWPSWGSVHRDILAQDYASAKAKPWASVPVYIRWAWWDQRCSCSISLSLSWFPCFCCVAELTTGSAIGFWKWSCQFRVCPSTLPSSQTADDASGSQSTFHETRSPFSSPSSCWCVRTTWMFSSTRIWASTPSTAKYVALASIYFKLSWWTRVLCADSELSHWVNT